MPESKPASKNLETVGDARDDVVKKLVEYQAHENHIGSSTTKEVKAVGADEVLIRTPAGGKFVFKGRKLDD